MKSYLVIGISSENDLVVFSRIVDLEEDEVKSTYVSRAVDAMNDAIDVERILIVDVVDMVPEVVNDFNVEDDD